MSYQSLVEAALKSLADKLEGVKIGPNAAFKTVAMTEPSKMNITRMPAAYILLDKDTISKKARYLEFHSLQITVSIVRIIQGTQYSDTDLEKGFHDGIALVGAVYDSLVVEHNIEIKNIDYGRAPLDVGVAFWGELQLQLEIRYAPGKPVEDPFMQMVKLDSEVT